MPFAIAAAALGGAASTAIGGIGGAIVGAVIVAGATAAYASTTKKEAAPRQMAQQNVTQRDPVAAGLLVYGQARVGGIVTYMESTNSSRTLHMVITFCCHEIDSFVTWYFNDEVVTFSSGIGQGRYSPYVYKEENLGTSSQAAFPTLVASSAGLWTSNHKQLGRAGAYIQLASNPDLWNNGIPNITAVIKGAKVYDPRSGLTVYSNNPALCLADYLTNTTYGLSIPWANIDTTYLTAAANTCDESVSLAAGGTESRYTVNGSFSTSATPQQIIEALCTSMSGSAICIGGQWYIIAGAYRTPTVTYDEGDLAGPISVSTRLSRRDTFNSVKGVFTDPNNRYTPSEFPAYSSSTYIAEDSSETIWTDVDYSMVTSGTQAQRLAKIALERSRRQISVSLKLNLRGLKIVPGDTFMLSNTAFGWSSKVFECTNLRFGYAAEGLTVDIDAREIDSNVFVWTTAEEAELPAAPTTSLSDPFTVGVPGSPSFSESLYETSGSAGVKTKLTVSWTDSDDGQVTAGGWYQLEYSSDNSNWTVITNIKATSYEIFDAQPGLFYFRVKALNVLGFSSSYSTATYTVVGLSAVPVDVRSFAVRPVNGYAHLTWALHDDLDVRIGGVIEVRHTATGSLWSDSVLIDRFNGGAVGGIGPLIQGYYLAKARDSSNNYSSSLATFFASEAVITGFTTVNSIVEAPSFTGSKSNVVVNGGTTLQLSNTNVFSGTYYFPNSGFYVDCGSNAVRRYEADITLTRFDTGDLIDSRASVDTWSSVDGGAVDQGDVELFVSVTSTHPGSSTSVWSSWIPFKVAELEGRGARFKLDFSSDSATHNIGVTTLNVHIKR